MSEVRSLDFELLVETRQWYALRLQFAGVVGCGSSECELEVACARLLDKVGLIYYPNGDCAHDLSSLRAERHGVGLSEPASR